MKKIFALPLLLILAACGDSTPQQVLKSSFDGFDATYECIDWKGGERCFYTIPPKEKPTRLIVALHPAFTTVKLTEDVSHLAQTVVPKGYLVIYPVGIDKQWNDGRVMTEVLTYQQKTDDVGFINEVTRRTQKKYGIGVARTTVAGMSNGGMMSLRLACQSEQYGSVATVVANLPKDLRNACKANAKPMLMIFGGADDVVKHEGGILANSGVADEWGEVESAAATQEFFAKRNGCDGKADREEVLANADIDSTKAHIRRHGKCGTALTSITVENMGHTWPGERSRFLAWISTRGKVSQQFNAGDAIVEFIEAQ